MEIKINPFDIKHLFSFIRNFLIFDEEKIWSLRLPRLYKLAIFPNYLLVPVYRYSRTPLEKLPGVSIEYKDKIDPENLSYFRDIRLPNDSKVKIELSLEPSGEKSAKVWGLRVNIGDPNYRFAMVIDEGADLQYLDEDIRTIRWAKGRSYSKYLQKQFSEVADSIYRFEEFLFVTSNLLYTLYTGEYRKNVKGAELFDYFTKVLQEYGNTFEEALSIIKEISIISL
jgi:hypothetical protein